MVKLRRIHRTAVCFYTITFSLKCMQSVFVFTLHARTVLSAPAVTIVVPLWLNCAEPPTAVSIFSIPVTPKCIHERTAFLSNVPAPRIFSSRLHTRTVPLPLRRGRSILLSWLNCARDGDDERRENIHRIAPNTRTIGVVTVPLGIFVPSWLNCAETATTSRCMLLPSPFPSNVCLSARYFVFTLHTRTSLAQRRTRRYDHRAIMVKLRRIHRTAVSIYSITTSPQMYA